MFESISLIKGGLSVVLLFICFHSTASFNYCTVCKDHTVCRFSGIGSRCHRNNGKMVRGLHDGDKERILKQHNVLRNKVASGEETRGQPGPQPHAANMRTLVWDNELAFIAQRWTDQCIWGHDSCRKTKRGESVGQNMALESCSSKDKSSNWVNMINKWYNEVKLWSKNSVGHYRFSTATGHYSQVVWATTQRVGCGFTRFVSGNKCQRMYACNYAPSGNFIGQAVYKRGSPRSKCPRGSRRNALYPALC